MMDISDSEVKELQEIDAALLSYTDPQAAGRPGQAGTQQKFPSCHLRGQSWQKRRHVETFVRL